MGKTVALVEPTNRIGGMTTNGLSFTDLGNTNAIQGLAASSTSTSASTTARPRPSSTSSPRRPGHPPGLGQDAGHLPLRKPAPRPLRRRRQARQSDPIDPHGERPDVRRDDVHRRQLRGRPDGRAGVSYPVGREANASTARPSTACSARATPAPLSSSSPSTPTSSPATRRAACSPASTPTPIAGQTARATAASRPTTSACAPPTRPRTAVGWPQARGLRPGQLRAAPPQLRRRRHHRVRGNLELDAQPQDRHQQQLRRLAPTTSA